MKGAHLLVALLLVSVSFGRDRYNRRDSRDSDYNAEPQYFLQYVDHFNPEDNRTFTQKFYMNTTYWKTPDSPIFFEINGEAPCSGIPSNQLQIYAQMFGAMIVTMEHRYYGESMPVPDQSFENMKYLTTRQALEDIAVFIQHLRLNVLENNTLAPLVTFGCSYAGALSAWFRLKYPHLTIGTVSSSGVVNAVLDMYQFDVQVAASVGDTCANDLRKVTKIIEYKLNANPQSNAETKSDFLASGFVDADFYWLIADAAAESVQYGYQNLVCSSIAGLDGQDLYNAYLNFSLNFYYPVFLGGDVASYSSYHLQNESIANGDRTWWWQVCSELGYFQNAPSENSIRSSQVNMTYHKWMCNTAFGHNLWPATDLTNLHYGGANTQGSNIYFLQSSQDPWQWAGVRSSPNMWELADIVECEDCGHCSDLRGCPSLPGLNVLEGCQNQQEVDLIRDKIIVFLETIINNYRKYADI